MVDQKAFEAEIAKKAKYEYDKKWRAEHPEKINEYNRKWRAKNPDKVKEYNQRYWAKKFESDMIKEVEQRTNEEESRC